MMMGGIREDWRYCPVLINCQYVSLTRNLRSSRFCWRFRIDGFVSNECGRLRFFADAIAAAAATPTGPAAANWAAISSSSPTCIMSASPYADSTLDRQSSSSSSDMPEMTPSSSISIVSLDSFISADVCCTYSDMMLDGLGGGGGGFTV